jgi:hypothetical protein
VITSKFERRSRFSRLPLLEESIDASNAQSRLIKGDLVGFLEKSSPGALRVKPSAMRVASYAVAIIWQLSATSVFLKRSIQF